MIWDWMEDRLNVCATKGKAAYKNTFDNSLFYETMACNDFPNAVKALSVAITALEKISEERVVMINGEALPDVKTYSAEISDQAIEKIEKILK